MKQPLRNISKNILLCIAVLASLYASVRLFPMDHETLFYLLHLICLFFGYMAILLQSSYAYLTHMEQPAGIQYSNFATLCVTTTALVIYVYTLEFLIPHDVTALYLVSIIFATLLIIYNNCHIVGCFAFFSYMRKSTKNQDVQHKKENLS